MTSWGLVLLVLGGGLLCWCSVGLAHANPGKRLPGSLPGVEQPSGYMPVGILGIVVVIVGALMTRGSYDALAWLLAGVTAGPAIVTPMVRHNRRLG